ncbi:unnamed protein product [Rotaria socialis]|uniref:Uncharacterized protein n=1 Tax=Rotaria socialis TaxID=392032 RepID=A0A818FHT9_9BILA|nr:unnamed protein product [Rotaria socialis]CAF4874796.1 unnamed protein product [Rotaria socialis]
MPNFSNLLQTIVLNNSCASLAFFEHWIGMISPNYLTPSIERLVIIETEYYTYGIVYLIKHLTLGNTLQYIHLVFEYPDDDYMHVLVTFVKTQTSVHSMILEVENGHRKFTKDIYSHLLEMKPFFWSRAVQLTLSVQYPFEIIVILQSGAIPLLEHLNITFEQEQFEEKPYLQEKQPDIQFCQSDIRRMTDATRLQSLLLRHLALNQLIILLDSLNMPLLKKLTLVDIFDETLANLDEFRRVVDHNHLPALKHLYFLLCFPGNFNEILNIYLMKYGNIWPFNNIGYHLDEQLISEDCNGKTLMKTVLLFYTHPFDILQQYIRTVHNHSFTKHSNIIQQRSIEWICNKIDSLNQLSTTLNILAGGHLKTLHLHYYKMKTSIKLNVTNSLWSDLYFHRLRSVTFTFEYKSMKRSRRVYIIDHILNVSPGLSNLVVDWNDFRSCSCPNTNVRYVHFILKSNYDDPNAHIDVNHLFQLLPGICCFETSDRHIAFNQSLVDFVLKIINTFHRLVELTLNKEGWLPVKPEKQLAIKQAILAADNKRLFDSNTYQIIFPIGDKLTIWL